MIIAPNHMGDLHIDVIDNHRKVIRWHAITPGNNQIIKLIVTDIHFAANKIFKDHRAL